MAIYNNIIILNSIGKTDDHGVNHHSAVLTSKVWLWVTILSVACLLLGVAARASTHSHPESGTTSTRLGALAPL